jgi:hypothetical protein
MELCLSGSLSHELSLFSRWNSGYQEAFSRIFLSHGGISSITEPFSRTFLSHGGISAITEPVHEFFFHMVESLKKMHDVGEDSFHIYHKEYLHRIRLVKNLAS